MPRVTMRIVVEALAAIVICAMVSGTAFAQDMPQAQLVPPAAQAEPTPNPTTPPPQAAAPPASAQPAPTQPAPAEPAAQKFSVAQLDQLVSPIALYPDPLLSQVLMASTYPLEVVEAARWVREPGNRSLTGDALTAALKTQNWDPSVMALVPFPRVLAIMADRVQWTEQLGNAFLAQQSDVMASVQRLRHAALAAGNLKATPECHCIIQTSGDQIVILPSEPKVVCIPVYNPRYVYGAWWEPDYPPIMFPVPVGFVYEPGFWIGFEPPIEVAVFGPLWGWGWFDWGGGRVVVDNVALGRLDPSQAAFANGTWIHDPAHRRGVAYASAAVATRFGSARTAVNVAAARGATTFAGRGVAPAGVGSARSVGAFSGAGRGFVGHTGVASRSFVGHGGPGAFRANNAFVHGAGPQIARGHTAPAQFSPGGGPHAGAAVHGPGGGVPRGGGPGGAPHGGGPGGGGHHH
ncbi:MAG TPA: DUF3300 domain-containing protein [Stellaceae bacterium]|nr:DUF3300 domain-containing protein [Stellaceae bacterium]